MKLRNKLIAGTMIGGLLAFGATISSTCVPGNADYEAGTGICIGTNAESDAAKIKAEFEPAKEDWVIAAESHELSMRWGCEDAIKSGLKDPRSYQANDVRYFPSMSQEPGALVMVKINYTARNGFGGATRGNAVCHADTNGNILSAKYL